ncbi:MAG: hypothetical protein ACLP5H_31365 [Desulfomonilaceae bacterium]
MDSKLLQTLRYRLQNRVRRLKTATWQGYHWQLAQFWDFLNSAEIFSAIMRLLEQEKVAIVGDVQGLIDGSLPRDQCVNFKNEKDQAAACIFVLRACVAAEVGHVMNQKEILIGKRYAMDGRSDNFAEIFTETFVMPLYEYLDEQLDSQNLLLYLLVRYKHTSEWFRRKVLLERCTEAKDSGKGEKVLAYDLYEFLYSQGLDFHIEPKSATGEIDLMSEQVGEDRLLVDAKVFSDTTSNIKAGFHQILTYSTTYNQPFGCLAIFNVGDKQLCFSSQRSDPQFGIFRPTGRLCS